jgi:hypothetical protein
MQCAEMGRDIDEDADSSLPKKAANDEYSAHALC